MCIYIKKTQKLKTTNVLTKIILNLLKMSQMKMDLIGEVLKMYLKKWFLL